MDGYTAVFDVVLINCPIGAMCATVSWGNALVGIDNYCFCGAQSFLANNARAIDNDDIGIEFDKSLAEIFIVHTVNFFYGRRKRLNRFETLVLTNYSDLVLTAPLEKWSDRQNECKLINDWNQSKFSNAVFYELDARDWVFDKSRKKPELSDQMVVDDPCRWIVAAEQDELFLNFRHGFWMLLVFLLGFYRS